MLIFLDFDGVTHPYGGSTKMDFCELPRITRILREPKYAHVQIVVSSSWRMIETVEGGVSSFTVLPLEQVQQHFPEDLRSRVIGVTPCLGELAEGIREREIRQWLAESGDPDQNWIALDDFAHLFGPNCHNLILVESATGLDDAVESRLRRLLSMHAGRTGAVDAPVEEEF